MLEKNSIHQSEVLRTGYSCEGVCQIDGQIVFVEDSLPGELLEIKIIKTSKSFAVGKLLKILKPSIHRIKPLCEHRQCGGCQLDNVEYNYQLYLKKNIIQSAFRQNANLTDIPLLATIPSENITGYRNKVIMPVALTKDKIHEIGFYAKRSHRIINISNCQIQPKITDKIITVIKKIIPDYNISVYDEGKHSGLLRSIMLRFNNDNSNIMLVFIIIGNFLPQEKKIIKRITESISEISSIYICANTHKTNVILSTNFRLIFGNEYLSVNLLNLKFLIAPNTFFQVNYKQTEKMYSYICELIKNNFSEPPIVFDIYSGVNSIAISISGISKKIYSVEENNSSVILAREIFKLNNIINIDSISGDSAVKSAELLDGGISPELIIFDPPRSGCNPSELKKIAQFKIPFIIYVSCNPQTLARDTKILIENNYKLISIKPIDMFPMTYHIENIVLFSS